MSIHLYTYCTTIPPFCCANKNQAYFTSDRKSVRIIFSIWITFNITVIFRFNDMHSILSWTLQCRNMCTSPVFYYFLGVVIHVFLSHKQIIISHERVPQIIKFKKVHYIQKMFWYVHSICSIRMEQHKWMNVQENC